MSNDFTQIMEQLKATRGGISQGEAEHFNQADASAGESYKDKQARYDAAEKAKYYKDNGLVDFSQFRKATISQGSGPSTTMYIDGNGGIVDTKQLEEVARRYGTDPTSPQTQMLLQQERLNSSETMNSPTGNSENPFGPLNIKF